MTGRDRLRDVLEPDWRLNAHYQYAAFDAVLSPLWAAMNVRRARAYALELDRTGRLFSEEREQSRIRAESCERGVSTS